MKKIIFSLVTIICIISCTKKTTQSENNDSVKIAIIINDLIATDQPKSEVLYLEDILQCVSLQGLEKKFGKENIKKDAVIETGEGQFNATKIFPNTNKEVEVYWKDGKDFKEIQDVMVKSAIGDDGNLAVKSPWISREGLRMGMKIGRAHV